MNYIDFKISLKSLIRFGGLSFCLYMIIMLSTKFADNDLIMIISCFSFFIAMYFLIDATSTMSSESIKYDKRTITEIEQDNLINSIHLINAAQNAVILKYVNDDLSLSNLEDKLENLNQMKTSLVHKLEDLSADDFHYLLPKNKEYV